MTKVPVDRQIRGAIILCQGGFAMRPSSAAILALVISGCAFGQTSTIKTFAGGGLPVNVAGTSASLRSPSSVAVDGAGNLFFTDERHVVLRLDATTGVLTLAAGNGTAGFSGDKGPATSAQLNLSGFIYRGDVHVDSAGNLYIAESGNQRIRKVSNGVITTVAGTGTNGFSGDNGPATSAQLSRPAGVAVDAAGNHRIRKVSKGVITTVAGSGEQGFSGDSASATSAQLSLPTGVAVDAAGNLYIADLGNRRIRKVSKGVITTVAGNGMQGFSGDNASATSAQLMTPSDVTVDAAGNLYVVDAGNHRIRKVSNGVITTVAGNGR